MTDQIETKLAEMEAVEREWRSGADNEKVALIKALRRALEVRHILGGPMIDAMVADISAILSGEEK